MLLQAILTWQFIYKKGKKVISQGQLISKKSYFKRKFARKFFILRPTPMHP